MTGGFDPALATGLVAVLSVWVVTVLVPGPNFLAAVHVAHSQSRRAGVLVALGIAVGTAVWATASLAGLGLIFRSAGWLYQGVKIAGAAYLIFIGIRTIITARRQPAASRPEREGRGLGTAFRLGLLTDLSNPKAAAFFTSLFALAVPPDAPMWFDAAVIALVVVIAGGWYALVAWAVASRPGAALFGRARTAPTYVAGAVFVGFGLKLVADR